MDRAPPQGGWRGIAGSFRRASLRAAPFMKGGGLQRPFAHKWSVGFEGREGVFAGTEGSSAHP